MQSKRVKEIAKKLWRTIYQQLDYEQCGKPERDRFEAAIAELTSEPAKPDPQPFNVAQAISAIREALRARLLTLIDQPTDTAANIALQIIDALNLVYRLSTHPAIVELQIPF